MKKRDIKRRHIVEEDLSVSAASGCVRIVTRQPLLVLDLRHSPRYPTSISESKHHRKEEKEQQKKINEEYQRRSVGSRIDLAGTWRTKWRPLRNVSARTLSRSRLAELSIYMTVNNQVIKK